MLVCSLLLLLTTVNNTKKEQIELPFTTGEDVSGELSLALPTEIYAGDNQYISLSIDLNDGVDISSVSLIVHLEVGFDEIEPAGFVNVNLLKPEPVHLEWRMRTANAGEYPGTLWIWVDTGEGKDLVMAKEFQVRSKFYLGGWVGHFRIAYGVMGVLAIVWLFGLILKFKHDNTEQN